MADWSARQYLKFEDERTRPPRDLLAQVPLQQPRLVVDLGCGPGNSTELLVERFPQAEDHRPRFVARHAAQGARTAAASAPSSRPTSRHGRRARDTDLLFANAVFQWVPDHPHVLRRLLEALPAGGVLAVQMPDNTGEPAHRACSARWPRTARGRPALAQAVRPRRRAAAGGLLRPAQAGLLRISTSGTASTITSWRRRRRLSNGSRAPRCSRYWRSLDAAMRERNFSPPILQRSPPPISRASTARCC